MSLDNQPAHNEPLGGTQDLIAYFRTGEKPADRHRVGMEHEKLGQLRGTFDPVPYGGPRGIRELLTRFSRFGYEPFLENGEPIAAVKPQLSISLEPGGQLELSGQPFHCCNDLAHELTHHLAQVRALSAELGLTWLSVGYRPVGTTADAQWVPKGRYARMRAHLATTGTLGLDMMTMTATVQANFDYRDEEDMVRKVQTATRVSPLVTALFANSPLREGRRTGYLSYRTNVWRNVDPLRCGLRREFLADGFGYAAYTEWALDVPMIFVRRQGRYLEPGGLTFRRFLAEGLAGERATLSDWEDHLTTLFPETRLKRVIEVRGADVGAAPLCLALPALWKGILYSADALTAAAALVPLGSKDFDALVGLQEEVARTGLAASLGRRSVRELCAELCAIARTSLRSQEHCGPNEGGFLEPLAEILERGRTPAEEALRKLDEAPAGPEGSLPPALVEHWRIA